MENVFKEVDLTGIEKAVIQDDCVARTFRSGGGLRVMRIEKKDQESTLVGYGEHITFIPMLDKASKDYNMGGSRYESEYYTGSSNADSMLDVWTLQGGRVFVEKEQDGLKVSLRYFTGRVVFEATGVCLSDALGVIENWLGTIDLERLGNYLLDESMSSGSIETDSLLFQHKSLQKN